MFGYCRLLQCPFPAGLLVLPQPVLQPSSGLTDVDLTTTVVDLVHDLGPLSIGRGPFTRVSTERSDSPDLKMTFMTYFLHTRLMSSPMPAVYGSITKGGLFPSSSGGSWASSSR